LLEELVQSAGIFIALLHSLDHNFILDAARERHILVQRFEHVEHVELCQRH
jgi:hypothetical protein